MVSQYYFPIYLSARTDFFYLMTAHPIFPESRRKLVHIAVALCVVMVAVLLAAGCTTTPTVGNLTVPPTDYPVTIKLLPNAGSHGSLKFRQPLRSRESLSAPILYYPMSHSMWEYGIRPVERNVALREPNLR